MNERDKILVGVAAAQISGTADNIEDECSARGNPDNVLDPSSSRAGSSSEEPQEDRKASLGETEPRTAMEKDEYPPQRQYQRQRRQRVHMQLSLSKFSGLSFLAQGAMCKCFIARSDHLDASPVVLKMCIENGPRQAERDLNTELKMLQNLSHANLVKLLGAGKTPKGRTFLVVEYLDGGTLRRRLDAAGGGLGFWPACKHALELASVMRYMHHEADPDRCVMHRDLKPDNVGFSGTELKLFDLGLSKIVRRAASGGNKYKMTGEVGSLRYMAPEVARQDPYNEKADVHSFGMILWEMVTGWLPFSGLSPDQYMFQVVQHGHRPMLQYHWHPEFKKLLTACWAESPRARPSFVQIHDALEALLAQRGNAGSGRLGKVARSTTAASSAESATSDSAGAAPPKRGLLSRFLGRRPRSSTPAPSVPSSPH